MRRREFIVALGSAAAWPMVVPAQAQRSIPIVGFLSGNSSTRVSAFTFFREGMKTEGLVEGQGFALEFRAAEGKYDILPALAAELVDRKVSIIVADGAVSAPLAAKQATTTIPIVFFTGSDPVQWGLVSSLSRPGGNITGVSISYSELLPKRIEIMRELAPQAPAVGLIVNPNNPNSDRDAEIVSALSGAGGWTTKVVKVTREQDLEAAFDALAKAQVGSLTIGNDALLASWSPQIVSLAARYKNSIRYCGRTYCLWTTDW